MKLFKLGLAVLISCMIMPTSAFAFHKITKLVPAADKAMCKSIGQEIDQQIQCRYRVLNNCKVQRYVDSVGQRLAKTGNRCSLKFKFGVLCDPNPNAFAIPGGKIYITTGMLKILNTEAELAAVLAHEMGHVLAKHTLNINLCQMRGLPLDYTGMLSSPAETQSVLPALTELTLGQSFNPQQEQQANQQAAALMACAGYNANGLACFWNNVNSKRQCTACFLARHPVSDRSVQQLVAFITANRFNLIGLTADTCDFHTIKNQVG